MKLLAIDTVTEACSVGLLIDNDITESFEVVPRSHTQRVLPMVDDLLSRAGLSVQQLDGLVLDRGPGSFTGLRIGTSVIQGLGFATNLPVVPVSSLAALAQAGLREHGLTKVLSVMDARMGEVYWGFYSLTEGYMQLSGTEQISQAEHINQAGLIPTNGGDWTIFGTGCQNYAAQLAGLSGIRELISEPDIYPRARYLLELAVFEWQQGNTVAALHAQPVYLRNNVAQKPKQNVTK
ncbi:MAG: tRNA (adenosine(37)-N6)-threonylcarbamoyltransferase complex dimerization subunit type 1 TsaB [Gammaproteobacteria bacterium]|nr:tRNA (adenosine(37)-N6)-threonylcarbamoyltransferase complex dimerization subunit type 1 TsaB [Gammaproteobacteria bacterium]